MSDMHVLYRGTLRRWKRFPNDDVVVVRFERGKLFPDQNPMHISVQIDDVICNTVEELDNVINELIKARMVFVSALQEERFGSGCTCRAVPVPEIKQVLIAGEDDCPVHGFGEENITLDKV